MAIKSLKEIQELFYQELEKLYPKEEIRNIFYLILNFKAGFSKTDILIKGLDLLNEQTTNFCMDSLDKLKSNMPVQYIIGQTEFYGLPFLVNPSVLIPRPETEELVEWIIDENKITSPYILDIGTGSGCIPISLKKNIVSAIVSSWDVSEKALKTAKNNAIHNNVEVNFQHQDILTPPKECEKYDIIVSNPPYIRESEKELMHQNVLAHEPHLALFVSNNDPLLFYKSIAIFAKTALKKEGKLFFEINEAFGQEIFSLLEENGFKHIQLRNDLFGKPRMVKGIR